MAHPKTAASRLTPDQYLAGENDGEVRHEYVDGIVYAMAGASEAHGILKLNLAVWLHGHVPANCRLFDGDMKLRVQNADDIRFYYPDLFISCGPNDLKQHVRSDAIVVIEILSPSTQRFDRFEKLHAYTALPALLEYVLVDQEVPVIEVFRRRTGWQRERYGLTERLNLESIAQSIDAKTIYNGVFA